MRLQFVRPAVCFAVGCFLAVPGLAQPLTADPLPSWNDTGSKKAIVAFVKRVIQDGSPEFVPPAERIAVFDNDGTL